MQINRSGSDLWIWGLVATAMLILLLGKVMGPGSTTPHIPAAVSNPEPASEQLEPIGDAHDSYPVLSEPRQTGLVEAMEREQAAGESDSGL